ncbi:MAG: efflux RND transporter periplasmic adaptor subunit [Gemmataceae bacterium]|nr:efflux RND transporter periplasmic adaptor subunit [Gemmataceae bacterium]
MRTPDLAPFSVYRPIPILAILFFGCGLALTGCQKAREEASPAAKAKVEWAKPLSREIADSIDFNGRLEPSQTVEIRPQVSGYLVKDDFNEGSEVKAGAELFKIDDRPFQRALEGALARKAAAEAALKLTDAELVRARVLRVRDAISPEEVDIRSANQAVSKADVQKAAADVAKAQLDLEFTSIKAPITGKLSRKLVTVGNLVGPSQVADPLTTLVSQDPLQLYFSVDERTLLRYQRRNQNQEKSIQESDDGMPIVFRLEEERDFSHKAILNFNDNRIDSATGTLQLRADVANPVVKGNRVFTAGMRARVRLVTDRPYKALLVREDSVVTDLRRKFLWVLRDGKAERVEVQLGNPAGNNLRDVVEGLREDDQVVVRGIQRLRPGAPVEAVEVSMDTPTVGQTGKAGK